MTAFLSSSSFIKTFMSGLLDWRQLDYISIFEHSSHMFEYLKLLIFDEIFQGRV